jgi:hypothetical protein
MQGLATALTHLPVASNGPDFISGGSGWLGAGLLGLVLAWLLLRHLPEKDQLIMKLISTHEEQRKSQADIYRAERATTLDAFKCDLETVVEHCEHDNAEIVAMVRQEMSRLNETLSKFDDTLGRLSNRIETLPLPKERKP